MAKTSSHSHKDLHIHKNKAVLDQVTELWGEGVIDASTHINDTTIHVTPVDKTNWTKKTEVTLGSIQPVNGWWFKEVE